MNMEKEQKDASAKPEFDPWEWVSNSGSPSCNPGGLLESCALQAGRIIEANKSDAAIQNQALSLLNMVAGTLQIGWKNADGTLDEDAVRRSLVAMYMVGIESARLAITTKHDSVSIDEAIDNLKRQALSESGRRAADASHRENREHKAAALADWEAEGHKFSSMRAFARGCFERYGVKDFMTVYNWLREHRKTKA